MDGKQRKRSCKRKAANANLTIWPETYRFSNAIVLSEHVGKSAGKKSDFFKPEKEEVELSSWWRWGVPTFVCVRCIERGDQPSYGERSLQRQDQHNRTLMYYVRCIERGDQPSYGERSLQRQDQHNRTSMYYVRCIERGDQPSHSERSLQRQEQHNQEVHIDRVLSEIGASTWWSL